MPHYKYLIVGGGMTGDAAARGIRGVDAAGSIGMFGAELDPPYIRPPLTKALWKGRPVEKIFRGTGKLDVALHLGRRITALDPAARQVTDDRGDTHTYEKLLLATGGAPRRLPVGGDNVIYYRTLEDYRRLSALAENGGALAVLGSGFIGSEIAAALAMNGKPVVMIFPEERIGQRLYPADLSGYITDYYREKGITLYTGHTVSGIARRGSELIVTARRLSDDHEHELAVAGMVAGLGVEPDVTLARAAGLAVDNGIVVDASLRTSHPDIFAAGDVANFYNPTLERRMRVEHEDNANTMGRLAGEAMAGKAVNYDYLPFFYSDLFDLGYEAVGELDARLETVSDWQEPFRKGVVYYLRQGRVRGVLLWNVWEQVEAARRLIGEAGPFDASTVKGRLPAPVPA